MLLLWPCCESDNHINYELNDKTIKSLFPASGKTEKTTPISILGSGFTEGMKVKFGNREANDVSVINSTLLRAYSPTHEKGLVDIIVIYPDGTKRTLSSGYYYFDPQNQSPDPSINSLSPTSGPIEGNQVVTIKGTHFQNVTQVRFGGVPASNIQIWDDFSLTATTPPHSEGKVDISVYAADKTGVLTGGYSYTCWLLPPSRLFLMVIFAGALGGSIHGLRSLVWHVGKCDLRGSWLLKYYLLPVSGASIAVIFYLASMAGLYTLESTGNQILIGLSVLVGMFSAQAAEKLKSIAEGLLTRPQDSSEENNLPISVDLIKPSRGSIHGNTEVEIIGSGFNESTIVRFGVNQVHPEKLSQKLISVRTPSHDVGKVDVFVINQSGHSFIVRNGYEYDDNIKGSSNSNNE